MFSDIEIYISNFFFWISKNIMGLTVILGGVFGALLAIQAKFNVLEMSSYTLKRLTKKWGLLVLAGIVISILFSLVGLSIMSNA